MLQEVIRPDKEKVSYKYDALGRRLSKTFKKTTTKWIWNGNVPLHEWKQYKQRHYTDDGTRADKLIKYNEITWIFEENSFVPCGKIKDGKKFSILADHLGTPTQMYNSDGEKIWQRSLDLNGKALIGDNGACPFAFQGQYYDADIELCYNRYRYFDQNDGRYISQDPIGLHSGEFGFYNYVDDPNGWVDVFGLTSGIYIITNNTTNEAYVGSSVDIDNRLSQPSHEKAQTLRNKPGTKTEIIEVDLSKTTAGGGKSERSNKGNILRHYEQQELKKVRKKFKTNQINAEALHKKDRNKKLIDDYNAKKGKKKTYQK